MCATFSDYFFKWLVLNNIIFKQYYKTILLSGVIVHYTVLRNAKQSTSVASLFTVGFSTASFCVYETCIAACVYWCVSAGWSRYLLNMLSSIQVCSSKTINIRLSIPIVFVVLIDSTVASVTMISFLIMDLLCFWVQVNINKLSPYFIVKGRECDL